MKMAKPSPADIEAAGKAMALLNTVSSGYYPCKPDQEDSSPLFFDEDDKQHLRLFYDELMSTLETGWPSRVIGGMCFVIMYEKNEILDPGSDCIDLHPKLERGLELLEQEEGRQKGHDLGIESAFKFP